MTSIHDLFPGLNQAIIDAHAAKGGLTLGQCIHALQDIPEDTPLATPCGPMDSYRGYYDHLAIEPTGDIATAGRLLAECNHADGRVYEGYKGGSYRMGLDTPVWFSGWGDYTGLSVMGFSMVDGQLVIETAKID